MCQSFKAQFGLQQVPTEGDLFELLPCSTRFPARIDPPSKHRPRLLLGADRLAVSLPSRSAAS